MRVDRILRLELWLVKSFRRVVSATAWLLQGLEQLGGLSLTLQGLEALEEPEVFGLKLKPQASMCSSKQVSTHALHRNWS